MLPTRWYRSCFFHLFRIATEVQCQSHDVANATATMKCNFVIGSAGHVDDRSILQVVEAGGLPKVMKKAARLFSHLKTGTKITPLNNRFSGNDTKRNMVPRRTPCSWCAYDDFLGGREILGKK